MKNITILLILIIYGCNNAVDSKIINTINENPTENPTENLKYNEPQKTESSTIDDSLEKKNKPNWSNPFVSPYGLPIINIIRGYFLVGEFKTVKKFIVNSNCLEDDEFEYLLRNCNWGYDIKATNMKWLEDSTFVLTAKIFKNNTTGMEQYIGKVVNDTAKIFFFSQNKVNPLIFITKYPNAEMQCEINALAKTINFEYDSSNLTSLSKQNLNKLKNILINYPNIKILVDGHTSNEGSDDYNMKLSLDRAKSVRSYLIRLGLNSSNIKSNGFGSTSPIYSNNDTNLKSKNRRVEITIMH